ncbi:right-handed parallel beta-helix repeat-containing protein [Deinococcus sp.]|uniref:right-handed parallel beta-helix repeat-containing protein n=1 Tax=Deinococcus sp. TaxID=47478 RepID=UPI003C7C5E1A
MNPRPRRTLPHLLAALLALTAAPGTLGGAAPDSAANAAPAGCLGHARFLDPSGDDASPGDDPRRPWRSLVRASRAALPPGSCLVLRGGATFSGTLALRPGLRGVRVTSGGRGRATIQAGGGSGVVALNSAGVRIERLIVRGAGTLQNTGVGVQVVSTLPGDRRLSGVQLADLDVGGFRQAGVQVLGDAADGSKSGFDQVDIRRVRAHDNGIAGIEVAGPFSLGSRRYAHHFLRISGCTALHNLGIRGLDRHSGNGIVVSDVQDARLDHNDAHDNGERSDSRGGGPVGIWAWDSRRVLIEYNRSYGNKTGYADGDGFDLDGGTVDSVMRYNVSRGNLGIGFFVYQFEGARPMSGNRVYGNLSRRDGQGGASGGIVVGGAARDTRVWGNRVEVGPGAAGVTTGLRVWAGPDGVVFSGNRVRALGNAPLLGVERGVRGVRFVGNRFESETGEFAALVGGQNFSEEGARRFTDLRTWQRATGNAGNTFTAVRRNSR